MDVSHILDALNDAQRTAVTASSQHTLVLAGAGSGKTRVLVHRIAWLLETGQARPYHLLAVTFTNKAAREMQLRINNLINLPTQGMWAGTFHGIAHRLLRMHWETAQLPQAFQVLDSEDQLRTLKRIMKELGLDEKVWTPKQAQSFINKRKEEALRPQHISLDDSDLWTRHMVGVYAAYETVCQRNGLVDFAELLLRAYEMLRDTPDLLTQYRNRFRFLLIDEFQDTNVLQYTWLQLLAGEAGSLFIVGDDDQSIYSWRGAQIKNIQDFQQHYTDTTLVRLEQNYRSTGTILAAANALIANNAERLGKNLWTEDKAGEPIHLFKAFSETDEAQFVAERIEAWSGALQDIAILYRTSAQSRVLEEALLKRRIPYRIYGGLRFYERAEIKDVLAYLRLIQNPNDDGSFERVVNLPKRGIGNKSIENLRQVARQHGLSLWQATEHAMTDNALSKRASNNLQGFQEIIARFAQQVADLSLVELVESVIKELQLREHYKKEHKDEAQRRLENLDELLVAAKDFTFNPEEHPNQLQAFLSQAALEAGEGQGNQFDDCVQLMTLHLAKGLEFAVVFLCGLEEGLFPHQNSLDEDNLEEERRLCYVGVTRARQYLYLSHSETRYRYGIRDFSAPSRFIREIPPELVQEVRLASTTSTFTVAASQSLSVQVGERVRHKTYGEGIVLECEGQGQYARVQVKFEESGVKWLVWAFADLQRI